MIKASLKEISARQWAVVAVMALAVLLPEWIGQGQLHYAAINTDQYNHKIIVAKLLNPDLYAADPVFGDARNMAFYANMLFIRLMQPFLSSLDFFTAFFVFQPWLGLLYAASMFTLLFKLTARPYVAAFVALISGFTVEIFPLDYWSAYTVGDVLPRGFFLALTPLLFLHWLKYYTAKSDRLWLSFLLLGVAGNLHPVSWAGLTAALLLAQLLHEKFSATAFKRAAICGLAAAAPMGLFIAGFFTPSSNVHAFSVTENALLTEALYYAFSPANPAILNYWPVGIQVALGWFAVLVWSIFGLRREGLRREVPMLLRWFALSCVVLFLLFYAVNVQLVALGKLPVLVDAYRVLRFVLLPVIILAALWLSAFRRVRQLAWRMGAVFLLTAVLSGPTLLSDLSRNPLDVGGMIKNQALGFAARHGWWIAPRRDEINEWRAMAETADWLKQNTPLHTLVHVSHASNRVSLVVRALGERGVSFCFKDGGFLYYSNKPLMLQWYRVAQTMDRIHAQFGYCSETEWGYARQMGAAFLVCPAAENTGLNSGAMRKNAEMPYGNRYFSVFRL